MLRNREFRRFVVLFSALAAITITVGFVISPAAGILVTASSAALGAAFWIFTKARYRRLAKISEQIDLVLHHDEHFDLGAIDEGELSILHSDITKMTRRIREQNDELKRDKRHLADSLADIAHQLRTPLTSANLILSFLAKNPEEPERRAFVREMEGLLVRMDWLITALLKLSRLDAGVVNLRRETISVRELIGSALNPLTIGMELRGIEPRLEVPEDVVLYGDPGWLSEAIQNILKNCMENTPENGTIDIVCADNALYTEITVRDSGAGFDEEDLPRLFDRFYRGKNADEAGYGIGLALCKMIISRQGGSVIAANHPQGGAVFAIRFPK